MEENFKKGEFNLVQVIKLSIMVIAGLGMIFISGLLISKLDRIVELLYIIGAK